MGKMLKKINKLPSYLAVSLIGIYQAVLSPDHSWLAARFPYGYCRHYPSCSEYSKQSFLKFGFIKGLFFSAKRLLKCYPWADPKMDPIPN